jgi:hypothetical protein
MQRQLYAFANEYDAAVDQLNDDNDGQLSINNPLLFVFIGDQSLDALNAVYELNKKKWNNSKGVLYFHVYKDTTVAKENVFSLKLPSAGTDRKTVRSDLYRQFYEDRQVLVDLNRMARQISNRIAEYGKIYTSFQRLNMAIVTRIDDPCNILMQEIGILLKALLGESFKLIQMDMYGLMKEKQGEEYATSLGISFLRELDKYQDRAYSFKGKLHVTEDQIQLPVEHVASPLFDLVYLLSDKNEQAMFPDGGMEDNYEIICSMNLLKNRKIVDEFDHRHESYNNLHFRQNIQPAETKGAVYSTAGFSKMKRPNQAIALTVVSQFYQNFFSKLIDQSKTDKRTIIELLKLSPDALDRKVSEFVPGRKKLEEMSGLLSKAISLTELRKLTLGQAEEQLYGKHADAFFTEHFVEVAEEILKSFDLERELSEMVERKIINNPIYGLYCAYAWTSEQEERSIFHELRNMNRDTSKQLEEARYHLLLLEQESVELLSFSRLPFFKKRKIKKIIRELFSKVYGKKLEILGFEMKLGLLRRYVTAFERIHEPLKVQVEQMQGLEKLFKDTCRQSVSEANDYLGRNIPEYYNAVVGEIMLDLQAKKGEQFYFEDRYLGNAAVQLANGIETLLKRVIEVCKKEVFTYPAFRQSFEDELLQRANVTVRYEEKDHVLSKDELYRDLFLTLEEQATVHMDVYNYTHKHRYDEKYFFADFDSEFMQYAFGVDKGSRLYKLGCVHEKKTSGIEKLNIMGGFQLEDIMYVRTGNKYYETYMANGFQFHAVSVPAKESD